MTAPNVTRRQFVATSGGVIAGILANLAGPIAALVPSTSWALSLNTLNEHSGKTLLQFARLLYPHKGLEDAVYALAVKDLDAAAADPATAELLNSGIAALDETAQGAWLLIPEAQQLEIIRGMETTPFFQKVRSTTVVSLYNNDMAFAHFGYEGPAFSKGGYLGRGFNDLDWLPEPPESASPKG